jgi:hypothetical protein
MVFDKLREKMADYKSVKFKIKTLRERLDRLEAILAVHETKLNELLNPPPQQPSTETPPETPPEGTPGGAPEVTPWNIEKK